MRVKDVHVRRYGPMTPFDGAGLDGFTVIHGPNERGKTLLIDAIVRLLFKKTLKGALRRAFGDRARNIDRVDEEPEGFIVLEDGGAEHKLERSETLPDVFGVPLRPEDFRNVFVVRDSDLTVHDEDEYYEHVTETLTGMRTSEIEKVLEALRNRGRLRTLAADSPLANNADTDPPHVARRFEEAQRLCARMRATAEALRADGFDELVEALERLHERRGRLEEERRRLLAARDRDHAKKALAVVDEIKALGRALEEMPAPDEKDLRRWQRLSVEAEEARRTLAGGNERVGRASAALEKERGALEVARRAHAAVRSRLDRIDASLRPQRERYESDRTAWRRRCVQRTPTTVAAIAGSVALLGGGAVFVTAANAVAAAVAGAGAVIAVVALVQLWRLSSEGRELDARAMALCDQAREHGIAVDDVIAIGSAVADIERELGERADAIRNLEVRVASLERELKGERRVVSDTERRLSGIDGEIAELGKRTGEATMASLETTLRKRRDTASTREGRIRALESLIEIPPGATDPVAAAETEIHHRLADTPGDGDPGHDPERAAEVERELADTREQEQHAAGRRRGGQRDLDELRVLAMRIGVLEDVPPCRTTVELDHLAARLEGWCTQIETDAAAARQAVSLFQQIEAEERERVGSLFGEDSPVSEVFAKVTAGRYRAVHFEPDPGRVMVETRDGIRLPATVLSGGAFDQLYLAVRLAIARRLLGDRRGFFLLDDPFIKADRVRLDRLVATLLALAEDGWQFIYFTAKDEVIDALRPAIEADRVTLLALDTPPVPRAARTRPGRRPGVVPDNGQQRLEL